MWIDNDFPNIGIDGYTVTSNPSEDYNCIAWAAGDTTSWWSHMPGYRWLDPKRANSIDSLIEYLKNKYDKIMAPKK